MKGDFVFPEKWCIKTTPKTREIVNNFLIKNGYCAKLKEDYYCHFPFIKGGSAYFSVRYGYTEITFEQFKQYVLKEEIMEKKIIGYNLKDQKYRDAYLNLLPKVDGKDLVPGREVGFQADLTKELNIKIMKDLGLLDIWFDPVYEELKVGDYIFIIDATASGKYNEHFKYNGDILKITNIGKDFHGNWINHVPCSFSGGGFRSDKSAWEYGVHFRLATEEEILKSLTKMAIDQGFKPGIKINNNGLDESCKENIITNINKFGYQKADDSLWISHTTPYKYNMCIYKNGKWAEIVKTPVIQKFGYYIQFFDTCILIGDIRISKDLLFSINDLMTNSNSSFNKVVFDNFILSKEEINQIVEYYKS